MSRVVLVKCEDYEYNNVYNAVKRGVELLGGPQAFAKQGEKILLKPNLLSADSPERCSTTHYNVFKAVGELFKQTGADLYYGDSPGIHSPQAASKKTLIAQAADELNIKSADFQNGVEVVNENAMQNKKFVIAKGVYECDGLISLPKLKTHALTRMTGCIKNQFGCVPGALKGEFHVRIPDVNDFCRMLVDLNSLIKPRLYIMDGIYAMEGNGPRGGTPKKLGVILISEDPVALDATACRIIDLDPLHVPTIRFGMESGLGTYNTKEIIIIGDSIEDFYCPDFVARREPVAPYKYGRGLKMLRNILVPKPYIIPSLCVKCGMCIKACPVKPKVINWKNDDKSKPPVYDYKRCIRCYCCQELCPESAVKIKKPLIRKLLSIGRR